MLKHTVGDGQLRVKTSLPVGTYHQYCRNVYSQNGEDGLLETLLSELGINQGTFCEFGAGDGTSSSNTLRLIETGRWSGMAIEPNQWIFQHLQAKYRTFYPRVTTHCGYVTADGDTSLSNWLTRRGLDRDLDVLSIDIDGYDYQVWDALKDFRPKIVIFEINSYRDPLFDELHKVVSSAYTEFDPLTTSNTPDRKACGCSFMSGIKLGLSRGYIPVAFTGNITFVREDLCSRLKQFPCLVSTDPGAYVSLYSHLCQSGNIWSSNIGLISNTAIGAYYSEVLRPQGKTLPTSMKELDFDWINTRIETLLASCA